MNLIFFFLISSVTTHCSDDDDCEQIKLPSSKDGFRNRDSYGIFGHSLSRHSTSNLYSCFLKCAENCQCLSENFKENSEETENCKLNKAAPYTNPESLLVMSGWRYYEIVRSYLKKVNFVFTIHRKLWSYKRGIIEFPQWIAAMSYSPDRES